MKKLIPLVLSFSFVLSTFLPMTALGEGTESKYEFIVKEEIAKVLTPRELLEEHLTYMENVEKLKGNAVMDTKIQEGENVKHQYSAKWDVAFTEKTNVAEINFEGTIGETTSKSKLYITNDKVYMNDSKTNKELDKAVWADMDLSQTGDTFTSYLLIYLGVANMQSVFNDFVLTEDDKHYILTLTKEKDDVKELKKKLSESKEYNTLFGIDDLTTKFEYVYYIDKNKHTPVKSVITSQSIQKVQDKEIKGIHTITINYEETGKLKELEVPKPILEVSLSSEELDEMFKAKKEEKK